MGHFSRGCTKPAIVEEDGEVELSFSVVKDSHIEVVSQPETTDAWGGGAKDNSFANTIGGWASNVEPGAGGGGW